MSYLVLGLGPREAMMGAIQAYESDLLEERTAFPPPRRAG